MNDDLQFKVPTTTLHDNQNREAMKKFEDDLTGLSMGTKKETDSNKEKKAYGVDLKAIE